MITTVAGNGSYGFSGDGGPATSASLQVPSGVAVDRSGNIYIADYGNYRIRKVSADGSVILTLETSARDHLSCTDYRDYREGRLPEGQFVAGLPHVALIGDSVYAHFIESLEVIRAAGTAYDFTEYRAGRQTPVFFGSALTNFGLEPFLRAIVELAPPPQPRQSDAGPVSPTDERFTGFVFKIQANMDPRHRDRVAFVRVCSGRFTKDMTLVNSRIGRPIRASRAYRFFGRDRETVSDAYAGDILGLVNPGQFAIGDTLHTGAPVRYSGVPRFPAEHFGRVRLKDVRYKQFDDGLRQLEEEGLMQVFYVAAGRREPIGSRAGALQLDVITSRLRTEYGVDAQIDTSPFAAARWVADPAVRIPPLGGGAAVALDRLERRVILFASEWEVQYFERQHPDLALLAESPM